MNVMQHRIYGDDTDVLFMFDRKYNIYQKKCMLLVLLGSQEMWVTDVPTE